MGVDTMTGWTRSLLKPSNLSIILGLATMFLSLISSTTSMYLIFTYWSLVLFGPCLGLRG